MKYNWCITVSFLMHLVPLILVSPLITSIYPLYILYISLYILYISVSFRAHISNCISWDKQIPCGWNTFNEDYYLFYLQTKVLLQLKSSFTCPSTFYNKFPSMQKVIRKVFGVYLWYFFRCIIYSVWSWTWLLYMAIVFY